MMDYLIQRAEGLTIMTNKTSSSINYVDGTDVTVFEVKNAQRKTQINGYIATNTGSPVGAKFRILAKKKESDSYTKIAPYADYQDIESGVNFDLPFSLTIPKGHSYKVEVNCTTANSASVVFVFNIVEIDF